MTERLNNFYWLPHPDTGALRLAYVNTRLSHAAKDFVHDVTFANGTVPVSDDTWHDLPDDDKIGEHFAEGSYPALQLRAAIEEGQISLREAVANIEKSVARPALAA